MTSEKARQNLREQLSDVAIEMVQLEEYKGESLAGDDGKETEKTSEKKDS
jgi:hypothetical protein